MESAHLGYCDLAMLLFPICKMDKVIPISRAFSEDHHDPVWMAVSLSRSIVPNFLPPLVFEGGTERSPRTHPGSTCFVPAGPCLREASQGMLAGRLGGREAASPFICLRGMQLLPGLESSLLFLGQQILPL